MTEGSTSSISPTSSGPRRKTCAVTNACPGVWPPAGTLFGDGHLDGLGLDLDLDSPALHSLASCEPVVDLNSDAVDPVVGNVAKTSPGTSCAGDLPPAATTRSDGRMKDLGLDHAPDVDLESDVIDPETNACGGDLPPTRTTCGGFDLDLDFISALPTTASTTASTAASTTESTCGNGTLGWRHNNAAGGGYGGGCGLCCCEVANDIAGDLPPAGNTPRGMPKAGNNTSGSPTGTGKSMASWFHGPMKDGSQGKAMGSPWLRHVSAKKLCLTPQTCLACIACSIARHRQIHQLSINTCMFMAYACKLARAWFSVFFQI